jgi:hypothetical protein
MAAADTEGRGGIGSAALALVLGLLPAAGRPADVTTTISVDAIARYGPPGAMILGGVTRRWTDEGGTSVLTRGTYAQIGASAGINPAYAQGSVSAEWVPIAVLQLGIGYDLFGYFGANGSLLRLPSRDARFGRAELSALAGSEEAGVGHRLTFNPALRAKIGHVLLLSEANLEWYALASQPGWYYESEWDTLVARRDWILANRIALFADLWDGPGGGTLLVGPMHDVTYASAAAIARQRVGAALLFSRAGRWLGLDRMRIYLLAGINLVDRNREGAPFALLGGGGSFDVGIPSRAQETR